MEVVSYVELFDTVGWTKGKGSLPVEILLHQNNVCN